MKRKIILFRSNFPILSFAGSEITPRGRKEVAILLFLALSPGHTASREILKSILWSDRFPDQQDMSLRRALTNIRFSMGSEKSDLKADRRTISMLGEIAVEGKLDRNTLREVCRELKLLGSPFEDWLMGRAKDPLIAKEPFVMTGTKGNPVGRILITAPAASCDHTQIFSRLFLDGVISQLRAHGDIEIDVEKNRDDGLWDIPDDRPRLDFDTEFYDRTFVLRVRIFEPGGGQRAWSKRLQLADLPNRGIGRYRILAFCGEIVLALSELFFRTTTLTSYAKLQTAAAGLFSADHEKTVQAGLALRELDSTNFSGGPVKSWRAFHLLTQQLEFGGQSEDLVAEAVSLSETAMQISPHNALVWANAAQIHSKLTGDLDYAQFLAERALDHCDHDPYALIAMSHVQGLRGHAGKCLGTATNAALAARGLPNSYVWDMQLSLANVSAGDLSSAIRSARLALSKFKTFRPTLRYLTALEAAKGQISNARIYANHLTKIEPDFTYAKLKTPDYPIATFRSAGLASLLPATLSS